MTQGRMFNLHGVEIWSVKWGWEITDEIQGRLCKMSKEHNKQSNRMGMW
jgi:hypothetical protein